MTLIRVKQSQMMGKGYYYPCQATTKQGKPCSRTAKGESKYCAVHSKMYDVVEVPPVEVPLEEDIPEEITLEEIVPEEELPPKEEEVLEEVVPKKKTPKKRG